MFNDEVITLHKIMYVFLFQSYSLVVLTCIINNFELNKLTEEMGVIGRN